MRDLAALKRPRLCFAIAYAVLITVGVFSLLPVPEFAQGNDKLQHFVVYFGLSAGFSSLIIRHAHLIWVVAGLIAYGIALEVLQGMTEYRMMDQMDMLVNSLGVVGGAVIRWTALPRWFRQIEEKI